LILVCSDNGPEPGAGSAGPFRGTKGTLFEGGIRSPLIAWGPGLIPADRAGRHDDASVIAAIDLAPSLLTIAGIEPPGDAAFDGAGLSEAVLGKAEARRSARIFWRRPPDRKSSPRKGAPSLP